MPSPAMCLRCPRAQWGRRGRTLLYPQPSSPPMRHWPCGGWVLQGWLGSLGRFPPGADAGSIGGKAHVWKSWARKLLASASYPVHCLCKALPGTDGTAFTRMDSEDASPTATSCTLP